MESLRSNHFFQFHKPIGWIVTYVKKDNSLNFGLYVITKCNHNKKCEMK